jgi:hypothetical protein
MDSRMAIHIPTIQHRNASLPFYWLAKDKTKFEKKKSLVTISHLRINHMLYVIDLNFEVLNVDRLLLF